MTLYILSGYNNYYNRIIKSESSLSQYIEKSTLEQIEAGTNFVPNDGVNTEHVIGMYEYSGKGDYLIAYEPTTQEIVSRWFIIDSVRTRSGQYKLTLRRDLIADYYNIIAQSPMFIEKATVRDDDPAIYNSESVSVNQIKTNEYTLKDDSQSAWIVGYFNRDMAEKQMSITYSNPTVDYILNENETFSQFLANNIAYRLKSLELSFTYWNYDTTLDNYFEYKATLKQSLQTIGQWEIQSTGKLNPNPSGFVWAGYSSQSILVAQQLNKLKQTDLSKLMSVCKMYINTGTIFQPTKCQEIFKFSSAVIQTFEGDKKYQVLAAGTPTNYKLENVQDISTIDNVQAVKTYLTSKMRGVEGFLVGTPTFNVDWQEERIFLTGTDVSFETFIFNFPGKGDRVHLNDAPYDMFCIPYKKNGLKINLYNKPRDEDNNFTSMDELSALTAAQSLAELMGSNLYDLQILPFCPLQGWSMDVDEPDIFVKAIEVKSDATSTKEVIWSQSANFVIFFSTSSQGTINSEQLHLINTENDEEQALPLPMDNKKISNECDMYRLCSPNYNGQFQFSASKLNGISGFNVDYTYLPYSPYIHVNPNFSGLYGKDYDDARGLICQGDFSISYTSSKWIEYQVQNKNYANIFNRGTENLELTQEIQRKQQIFNAFTGTVMGGAGGALAGSKAGVPGMIVGGTLGTAASAVGGALDVYYGDKLRQEALDYRQDLYNYQLDNIQALPDSIAKVTAYTKNNKIFPILEYYTCTPTEKRAIANKIAYNGMTVGRIGTINEFSVNTWSYGNIESKGYIKGQLIRLDDMGEDFHIVNSISGELYKGVFIGDIN